mgnify:CR=1 FL=1
MSRKEKNPVVIVIDDDPEWREFVSGQLRATCKILGAASGQDGFRMARRVKPDLILLDVMMPGEKDGFTVFRDLRQDKATGKIPVVIVSEINRIMALSFDRSFIGEYLGHSPDAFVEKPVTGSRLRGLVARFTGAGPKAAGSPARPSGKRE